MGKTKRGGWGRQSKGKSKNARQRAAADEAEAAAVLAEGAAKRKKAAHRAAGASPKHAHVPEALGRGGARDKIDTDKLTPRSKKKVERRRLYVAKSRLKQLGKTLAVSDAVLADPTEAWRTKPSGKVNKNPDRARQRAGAELAAALPKNPALRGPAIAAFKLHPEGKRAFAAIGTSEAPALPKKAAKRLDALTAMASDIRDAFSHMQASATEGKRDQREDEAPGQGSARGGSRTAGGDRFVCGYARVERR